MLQIYLQDDKALIFEENGTKLAICTRPSVLSENDDVFIFFNAGGAKYNRRRDYSNIEVGGIVYPSATETVGAIGELASVFSPPGGSGSPTPGDVTIGQVDSRITAHNTSPTAHNDIRTILNTAIQSATIGTTPVPKVGTELQFPEYPTVPTIPTVPENIITSPNETIKHIISISKEDYEDLKNANELDEHTLYNITNDDEEDNETPTCECEDNKGVPGIYNQVSGAPANEFEFNDLQEFLDEKVNNRIFDDDLTILVAEDTVGDLLITNVLFTEIKEFVINAYHKLGNDVTINNINGQSYLIIESPVADNLRISNSGNTQLIGGDYGYVRVDSGNCMIRPLDSSGLININELVVSAPAVCTLTSIAGYTINIGDLQHSGTILINYLSEGDIIIGSITNSNGTIIDNRAGHPDETYQRNKVIVPGTYTQVSGTPANIFEFNDLQEFLDTRINGGKCGGAITININDAGSSAGINFINIDASVTINYLTGFTTSAKNIFYSRIGGYLAVNFDSEGLNVGGHLFSECRRTQIMGKADLERLDADDMFSLVIGGVNDTELNIGWRLTIRGNCNVTALTIAPATCKITMAELDNFGILAIGEGTEVEYPSVTARSQGIVINENADRENETYIRRGEGENTFSTTIDTANPQILWSGSSFSLSTPIDGTVIAPENGWVTLTAGVTGSASTFGLIRIDVNGYAHVLSWFKTASIYSSGTLSMSGLGYIIAFIAGASAGYATGLKLGPIIFK